MKYIKQKKIVVGKPNIGSMDKYHEHIDHIFTTKILSNNGKFKLKAEKKISKILNVKHCILVSNATIGLEIVQQALELSGEVIMPSFTFPATPLSSLRCGLKPVFCDINLDNHNCDVKHIQKLITDKTSAILVVNLWGNPADLEQLAKISKLHNLKLIYDSAHAFNCSFNDNMIGNFGDAEIFSFHATKFINSFEGGLITTNDDFLAERCRKMTNFSFEDDGDIKFIGTNGKMSEASAAMLCVSLDSMRDIIDRNKDNYEIYEDKFSKLQGISMLDNKVDKHNKRNYQYVVTTLKTSDARDKLFDSLSKRDIHTKKYFKSCHKMSLFNGCNPDDLPMTEDVSNRCLVFPTGLSVNGKDVKMITSYVKKILHK